jgi:lipopolysaccharide biosynthesis glycosyltransferase
MCDEKMNVMIVANMNYVKPLRVFLYSLFEHNPCEIDVYMLQSDIDDDTLSGLTRYCEHWKGKKLVPIRTDLGRFENFYATDDFPADIYMRLLCADILPHDVSKVLSLDLDMVVNKPLDKLYSTDIDGYPLAACKDIGVHILGDWQVESQRLGWADENCAYFNSGMMLMNLDYLRDGGFVTKMCEYARENADMLKYPEQDVLNYFFAETYLQLEWYDYNCVPAMYVMKEADVQNGIIEPLHWSSIVSMTDFDGYADYAPAMSEIASIIHYFSGTKPWKKERLQAMACIYGLFDKFYNEYEAAANALYSQIQKN